MNTVVTMLVILVLLVTGLIFLWLPALARRGLLFGVYVGESAFDSTEARALRRQWLRDGLLVIAAAIAVGLGWGLRSPGSAPILASSLLLILGTTGLYLRAHFRARGMAVDEAPPAVAALVADVRADRWPAYLAMGVGLLSGLLTGAHALMRFPDLPDRLPVHFGPGGQPDAWAEASLGRVLLMPLLTVFVGFGMGVVALFTATAKRGLRRGDGGASLEAQVRFRRAMTWFLASMSVFVTAMLAVGAYGTIQVALGEAQRLPPIFTVLSIGIAAGSLLGIVIIAFYFGQGGARLEASAASAPLTNGIADNRLWRLGVFYVNRDDPSVFVEKRFGVGYTINFGNPKAVFGLGLFILALLLLPLLLG